jgi:hypothetical protein
MDRVDALQAVGELAASPLLDTDDARCQWLDDLHRAETMLFAVKVRAFWAVEVTRAYTADGSKTAGAWLARECHASPGLTGAHALLARRLRTMPATIDALSVGDIGVEHATVLSKAASSPRAVIATAFPLAEATLVGFAKDLPYPDFVIAVNHWKNVTDPDGTEHNSNRSLDKRRVDLSQLEGGDFVLSGHFDAVNGTILDTALERIGKELWEHDWAAAKEANRGNDPTEAQMPRTRPQRRADAFIELAERAMATPDGARKPKPLVTVVVGLETLQGQICELFNKQPLAPGQVARMLDDTDIERVVFQGKSRVIELGERTRFFTGGLRRAIEIRDRHCQHPGCRRPAENCQADHIQPHGWGGLTDQTNGRLLCEFHNRWRVNGAKPKPKPPGKPDDEVA